jgi:hypothetical protein
VDENERHEYDALYDVPKVAISTERALEIEQESWDTTKKLTEAFSDSEPLTDVGTEEPAHIDMISPTKEESIAPENNEFVSEPPSPPSDEQGVYAGLREKLGDISEFVVLCRAPSLLKRRAFASLHSTTVDELADKINETAVDIFGDIILEDCGNGYTIIEDYMFLFN